MVGMTYNGQITEIEMNFTFSKYASFFFQYFGKTLITDAWP